MDAVERGAVRLHVVIETRAHDATAAATNARPWHLHTRGSMRHCTKRRRARGHGVIDDLVISARSVNRYPVVVGERATHGVDADRHRRWPPVDGGGSISATEGSAESASAHAVVLSVDLTLLFGGEWWRRRWHHLSDWFLIPSHRPIYCWSRKTSDPIRHIAVDWRHVAGYRDASRAMKSRSSSHAEIPTSAGGLRSSVLSAMFNNLSVHFARLEGQHDHYW